MLPEGELQSAVCQAGLAFAGISAGLLVSGGVFTVLLSVGLAPRFAGVTHTGNRIFLYEEMVVFGTLFGNVLSVEVGGDGEGYWFDGGAACAQQACGA